MGNGVKVAIVTNIVAEYRYQIFSSLVEAGDYSWKIFLTVPLDQSCERARQSLPLHYSSTTGFWLSTRHATSGAAQREPLPVPIGLLKDLLAYRPAVIIAGDWGLRSLVCLFVAKLLGIPLIMWSEDIPSSAAGRTSLQRKLRRMLARRANAFLAWGEPAAQYVLSLGAAAHTVYCCPQAADNQFWIESARTIDAAEQRQRLGLQGRVFLYVGRLVQRKGAENLLRAWSCLPEESQRQGTLVIVGSGEVEQQLRQLVAASGLGNVVFAGFQSGAALARYYAAADYLVLPSLEDVWGLAANEALCFGRPVLASRFAGASHGLVAKAGVGEIIDPADIPRFCERLRVWIESPPAISRDSCVAAIADMTYARATSTITQMLRSVLESVQPAGTA